MLLVGWFVIGVGRCGQVTATDAGELDGGPSDGVVETRQAFPGAVDTSSEDASANPATIPTSDGPPFCSAACEPCAHEGLDGPPYASAQQCAKVIACVRAGDAGAFPWFTCHEAAGAGAGDDLGGLHCAMSAAVDCR